MLVNVLHLNIMLLEMVVEFLHCQLDMLEPVLERLVQQLLVGLLSQPALELTFHLPGQLGHLVDSLFESHLELRELDSEDLERAFQL